MVSYSTTSLSSTKDQEKEELKKRIKELEAKVENLALNQKVVYDIPAAWGLTRLEALTVAPLVGVPKASYDTIMAACYGPHSKFWPGNNIISVRLCGIRRKLSPFGFTIETIHGYGLAMKFTPKQT